MLAPPEPGHRRWENGHVANDHEDGIYFVAFVLLGVAAERVIGCEYRFLPIADLCARFVSSIELVAIKGLKDLHANQGVDQRERRQCAARQVL